MNIAAIQTLIEGTFLVYEFLDNSLLNWLLAVIITIFALVLLRYLKGFVVRQLNRLAKLTKNDIDNFIAKLLGKTRTVFLLALAVYIGSLVLTMSTAVRSVISSVIFIALLFQAAIWGNALIDYWIDNYRKREELSAGSVTMLATLNYIGRLVLWSIVVLLALDNMNIEVTALIAGLGVSSIAVALAVQNILGDLFASLSIVFDKPFEIGDFIIVDNYLGTVENIGLRSTRMRSLSGEQLVLSNADLLSSRIRNYKRMQERRVLFTLGVTYDTPYEKLKLIPEIVENIISAQENARFDRAHFKAYGAYSLDFEVVYYMLISDYAVYMDTQQEINLALFKAFAEQGIEFAFPTQTLLLQQENAQAGHGDVQ